MPEREVTPELVIGVLADDEPDQRGNLMVAAVLPTEALIALALNVN